MKFGYLSACLKDRLFFGRDLDFHLYVYVVERTGARYRPYVSVVLGLRSLNGAASFDERTKNHCIFAMTETLNTFPYSGTLDGWFDCLISCDSWRVQ